MQLELQIVKTLIRPLFSHEQSDLDLHCFPQIYAFQYLARRPPCDPNSQLIVLTAAKDEDKGLIPVYTPLIPPHLSPGQELLLTVPWRYSRCGVICFMYSKIPVLRPPFVLPKSGLIRDNVIRKVYYLGVEKTGFNSEVILILGGLNSDILLYLCCSIFNFLNV